MTPNADKAHYPQSPNAEYVALAKHHRDCELAGERMDAALEEAASTLRLLGKWTVARRCENARYGWQRHQWPDYEASPIGRSGTGDG